MKVGDLVRVDFQAPWHRDEQDSLSFGIFLGYQDAALGANKMRSHVFVEGEKFLFLTRELEKVRGHENK